MNITRLASKIEQMIHKKSMSGLALGKHFHLFAVDTIGGPGKSTFTEAYNKDFDDVLWIDDILDGLSLPKTSIAGVSNGGYLVQLYTLCRSERVDKAISLAASVPTGKNWRVVLIMLIIRVCI